MPLKELCGWRLGEAPVSRRVLYPFRLSPDPFHLPLHNAPCDLDKSQKHRKIIRLLQYTFADLLRRTAGGGGSDGTVSLRSRDRAWDAGTCSRTPHAGLALSDIARLRLPARALQVNRFVCPGWRETSSKPLDSDQRPPSASGCIYPVYYYDDNLLYARMPIARSTRAVDLIAALQALPTLAERLQLFGASSKVLHEAPWQDMRDSGGPAILFEMATTQPFGPSMVSRTPFKLKDELI